MSKQDTEYLKFVDKLMAGKGVNASASRKPFYHRRSQKEIRSIMNRIDTLAYGEQTEYLKSIGARRSNLQNWRKLIAKWDRLGE